MCQSCIKLEDLAAQIDLKMVNDAYEIWIGGVAMYCLDGDTDIDRFSLYGIEA